MEKVMASGPSGVSGWSDFVAQLNVLFDDQHRSGFARKFRVTHGPGGNGEAGKPAYKFGRFVNRGSLLAGEKQKARFLIDAGTRRWNSDDLRLLEYIIKHSLTMPDPKQIIFASPRQDAAAPKAKAAVIAVVVSGSTETEYSVDPAVDPYTNPDPNIAQAKYFKIAITCPRPD